MKKPMAGGGVSQHLITRLARVFMLTGVLLGAASALAAPREAWWAGLIPEVIPPLFHETFDEAYSHGMI